MLYLNNPLLISVKIISYFETNLAELSQVMPEGSKKPSHLTRLKNKLKINFFHELVGCDLGLLTVSPGEIDLAKLPKESPILIKQGDKCFIYGSSTGKNWILTELSSPVINQANLTFPEACPCGKAA